MKRLFSIITICIVLMSLTTTPVFAQTTGSTDSNTVEIPSTALKGYLNGLLNQPADSPITEEQLSKITSITLKGAEFTDLTGLEKATNLISFRNDDTKITDFSPVLKNKTLEYLSMNSETLTNDNFPDINDQDKIINLTLTSSNFTNDIFKKIHLMPNLDYLNIQSNSKITDITLLADLPKLKTLFVQFDGIVDFTPINNFKNLKSLAAFGQNIGDGHAPKKITTAQLKYDDSAETLFIPFSIMPNRLTSFDGYQPPFTKSNSSSNTYLSFNGTKVDNSRLSIDDNGVTVNKVSKGDFDSLETFYYNARFDNPTGSYPIPDFMNSYTISSGTYEQTFEVAHKLTITSKDAITFNQGSDLSEADFLQAIDAKTDDGTEVTSDFTDVVDLNTPGTYTVTLNAQNEGGLKAEPTTVTVTVIAKPVIQADKEITYNVGEPVDAEQFLKDIHATVTPENLEIMNDFTKQVDFDKPGTYIVTLDAQNDRGMKADPVEITVKISPRPIIQADKEITYTVGDAIDAEQFLKDIHATVTPENLEITNDFTKQVDFSKTGTYTVTLGAVNDRSQAAEPVVVKVNVVAKEDTNENGQNPEDSDKPKNDTDKPATDKEASKEEASHGSDNSQATKDHAMETIATDPIMHQSGLLAAEHVISQTAQPAERSNTIMQQVQQSYVKAAGKYSQTDDAHALLPKTGDTAKPLLGLFGTAFAAFAFVLLRRKGK